MHIFETLNKWRAENGISYLVIGGLAVNHYGYSRETADVDILTAKGQREIWLRQLESVGYSVFHDGGPFIQFSPPASSAWPVDLMLVAETTFTPMIEAARPVTMAGHPVLIPSLDHLLALKLHALKHTRMHRYLKDLQDVEGLIRINKVDLRSERVRALFLKYGNDEVYEQIIRACATE